MATAVPVAYGHERSESAGTVAQQVSWLLQAEGTPLAGLMRGVDGPNPDVYYACMKYADKGGGHHLVVNFLDAARQPTLPRGLAKRGAVPVAAPDDPAATKVPFNNWFAVSAAHVDEWLKERQSLLAAADNEEISVVAQRHCLRSASASLGRVDYESDEDGAEPSSPSVRPPAYDGTQELTAALHGVARAEAASTRATSAALTEAQAQIQQAAGAIRCFVPGVTGSEAADRAAMTKLNVLDASLRALEKRVAQWRQEQTDVRRTNEGGIEKCLADLGELRRTVNDAQRSATDMAAETARRSEWERQTTQEIRTMSQAVRRAQDAALANDNALLAETRKDAERNLADFEAKITGQIDRLRSELSDVRPGATAETSALAELRERVERLKRTLADVKSAATTEDKLQRAVEVLRGDLQREFEERLAATQRRLEASPLDDKVKRVVVAEMRAKWQEQHHALEQEVHANVRAVQGLKAEFDDAAVGAIAEDLRAVRRELQSIEERVASLEVRGGATASRSGGRESGAAPDKRLAALVTKIGQRCDSLEAKVEAQAHTSDRVTVVRLQSEVDALSREVRGLSDEVRAPGGGRDVARKADLAELAKASGLADLTHRLDRFPQPTDIVVHATLEGLARRTDVEDTGARIGILEKKLTRAVDEHAAQLRDFARRSELSEFAKVTTVTGLTQRLDRMPASADIVLNASLGDMATRADVAAAVQRIDERATALARDITAARTELGAKANATEVVRLREELAVAEARVRRLETSDDVTALGSTVTALSREFEEMRTASLRAEGGVAVTGREDSVLAIVRTDIADLRRQLDAVKERSQTRMASQAGLDRETPGPPAPLLAELERLSRRMDQLSREVVTRTEVDSAIQRACRDWDDRVGLAHREADLDRQRAAVSAALDGALGELRPRLEALERRAQGADGRSSADKELRDELTRTRNDLAALTRVVQELSESVRAGSVSTTLSQAATATLDTRPSMHRVGREPSPTPAFPVYDDCRAVSSAGRQSESMSPTQYAMVEGLGIVVGEKYRVHFGGGAAGIVLLQVVSLTRSGIRCFEGGSPHAVRVVSWEEMDFGTRWECVSGPRHEAQKKLDEQEAQRRIAEETGIAVRRAEQQAVASQLKQRTVTLAGQALVWAADGAPTISPRGVMAAALEACLYHAEITLKTLLDSATPGYAENAKRDFDRLLRVHDALQKYAMETHNAAAAETLWKATCTTREDYFSSTARSTEAVRQALEEGKLDASLRAAAQLFIKTVSDRKTLHPNSFVMPPSSWRIQPILLSEFLQRWDSTLRPEAKEVITKGGAINVSPQHIVAQPS